MVYWSTAARRLAGARAAYSTQDATGAQRPMSSDEAAGHCSRGAARKRRRQAGEWPASRQGSGCQSRASQDAITVLLPHLRGVSWFWQPISPAVHR